VSAVGLFPLPARVGDRFYIHGSPASRMLRSLQDGIEVCVTVTLLDGLVLARSAFHHSMNYKSVVIFGTATTVQDTDQKQLLSLYRTRGTRAVGRGARQSSGITGNFGALL